MCSLDTSLSFIVYIVLSIIGTIALLVFAPALLTQYGFALAWGWISVLSAWMWIERLHADFEDTEFDDPRDRSIVDQLRRARAEHDSFGVGIGRNDPDWLRMVRLAERGYIEKASTYNDDLDDCWWRAVL